MKPVRKAVLPVAGLGTRVLPGTKVTPKELLNVVDRPILSYIIAEGRAAGIEHFVFVTGRSKGAIEDYFDHQVELEAQLQAKGKLDILAELLGELPKPGEMSFVRQMAPLGLGHAVWCARDIIGDEPFAVLLPDVIVDSRPGALKQLADVYARVGGNVIGVEAVPESETHKYGIVDPVNRDGRQIRCAARRLGTRERRLRKRSNGDLRYRRFATIHCSSFLAYLRASRGHTTRTAVRQASWRSSRKF